MLKELRSTFDDTAATAARLSKEACDEDREVVDTVEGVRCVLRYAGTHGRGSITTTSNVILDGHPFAVEYDFIPWNLFKAGAIWYNAGGLMSEEEADAAIERTDTSRDTKAVSETYPCDGPPLFFWRCESLESVVKLFKDLRTRHPERLEPKEDLI